MFQRFVPPKPEDELPSPFVVNSTGGDSPRLIKFPGDDEYADTFRVHCSVSWDRNAFDDTTSISGDGAVEPFEDAAVVFASAGFNLADTAEAVDSFLDRSKSSNGIHSSEDLRLSDLFLCYRCRETATLLPRRAIVLLGRLLAVY